MLVPSSYDARAGLLFALAGQEQGRNLVGGCEILFSQANGQEITPGLPRLSFFWFYADCQNVGQIFLFMILSGKTGEL